MPEPNSGPGRSALPGAQRTARPAARPASQDEAQQRRPQKRKSNPMGAIIALFVSPAVLITVIVIVMQMDREEPVDEVKKPPVVQENPIDAEIKKFQADMPAAQKMYKEMRQKLRDESLPREQVAKEYEATRSHLTDMHDRLDKILEPLRDKATGQLLPQYSGYGSLSTTIQEWLHDLHKESNF